MPLISGAKTKENPTINHSTDNSARPNMVCIITDNEFFSLSIPASKKPKAGVIIMTSPVDISIHVVSPVSIANGHRRFSVDNKVFLFILKNLHQNIKKNNIIIKFHFFDNIFILFI
jgi:hypothetical protein